MKEDLTPIQTRKAITINKICIAQETTSIVQEYFGEVYKFVARTGQHGLPAKDENNPAIKPIQWICTTDKSATWKVLQRGGACKNKSLFCESCECTSLEIISYKVEKYRCEWCKTKRREKCYHRSVNDQHDLKRKKRKLASYIEAWKKCLNRYNQHYEDSSISDEEGECSFDYHKQSIPSQDPSVTSLQDHEIEIYLSNNRHIEEEDDIQNKSVIQISPIIADKEFREKHIDFKPRNKIEERSFNTLLMTELQLRKNILHNEDTIEQRRKKLKNILFDGCEVLILRKAIDRQKDTMHKELTSIDKCIPCILHLEMRVSEKILEMLIAQGFKFRLSGREKNDYKEKITSIVNEEMFKHVNTLGQWRFPESKNGKTLMGEVKLTNGQAREFIRKIHLLLPIIFEKNRNNTLEQKWKTVIDKFCTLMELMKQRHDFSDEDISSF